MILIRIDSAATAVGSQYPGIGRLLGNIDPEIVNGFLGETIDSKVADEIADQLASKGIEASTSVVESSEGLKSSGTLLKLGLAIFVGAAIGYLYAKKG